MMKEYSQIIEDLFKEQFQEWELAKINYQQLKDVRSRGFDFGNYKVLVQFNPGRIRSSSAKVDPESIGERPCFLCEKNRPEEQKGVPVDDNLVILINPFPIFKRHLTIVSTLHVEQKIEGNFGKMLSLAGILPDFFVFYNGPRCGASAPDHFHFQAGNRGFLPLEDDFRKGIFTDLIYRKDDVELWLWKKYIRGIITLRGKDREKLENVFTGLLRQFSEHRPDPDEPLLNIIADYSLNIWTVHIFPRKKHRPSQFNLEGPEQLLVSPAAIDLGGVIITPRNEDFNRITRSDIEDIYTQVCYNDKEIRNILI